jgi:hypothetical protein
MQKENEQTIVTQIDLECSEDSAEEFSLSDIEIDDCYKKGTVFSNAYYRVYKKVIQLL